MALVTTLAPPLDALAPEPPPRPAPRRMTACECADVSFAEVARLAQSGCGVEQACERTGCGRLCTACIPDLEHFLRNKSPR
jgi:NAD(P)H-nitrite reductase large subunit